ncbi:MAG: hypothetical protein HKN79_05230 [Flavobacteriales bacterium]|nr:hypothetical protein [Flavobacteriales bacterium]
MSRYVKLIWSLAMLCSVFWCRGQEGIGMALSNYLPSHAVQLNPALAADSKTRFDILLGGVSLYATNEHTFYDAEGPGVIPVLFGNGTNPVQDFDTHPRDGYLDMTIDGPSAFAVLGRSSVGLSTRYRAMFNGQDMPYELAQFIYHGFRHWPLYDSTLYIDDMNLVGMSWGEVALTYARMIQVEEDHHLNAGVTVKRLFGQDHVGIGVGRMQYMFDSQDLYIQDFTGSYSLGTDDIGFGNGWAMDVGMIYRKTIHGNPDYIPFSTENRCQKSQYRYQLGVSVIDIGQVNFRQNSAIVDLQDAQAFWPNYIDTDVSNIDELDDFLASTFENDQNFTDRTLGTKVSLPTALNIQFDYNLDKGLFLGAVLQQPLHASELTRLRRASIFGVIPRYETDRMEFAVPISTYEYERLQVGLAFRYLGLTIGSDDLGVILSDRDVYGADFYAAIRIPVLYRPDCRDKQRDNRGLIAPCWGQ